MTEPEVEAVARAIQGTTPRCYPVSTAALENMACAAIAVLDGARGDGWQLVPKEPTREMWAAAGNVLVNSNNQHHDTITRAVWDGMLAAAPLPGDGK